MTGGFTRKKVESLTLGEKLKKLRSQYRMSLAEISRATRIQVKYLEALENGNHAELPAEVYVRGFLKNYARYLGLEDEAFLKLYDKEKNIRENLGQGKETAKETRYPVTSAWIITPQTVLITLITLVLGGTFLYLFSEFRAFVAEPRLVILEPLSGSAIDGVSLTLRGETDRGARVAVNGEPVFVSNEGDFVETLALQPGTNRITIAATNRFEKTKTEELTVESRAPMAPAVTPEESALLAESFSLTIQAREKPVQVTVVNGETILYNGTLSPGSENTLERLTGEIVVTTEDALHTFVLIDGKEGESMGEKEEILTKKYTKNGAQ